MAKYQKEVTIECGRYLSLLTIFGVGMSQGEAGALRH